MLILNELPIWHGANGTVRYHRGRFDMGRMGLYVTTMGDLTWGEMELYATIMGDLPWGEMGLYATIIGDLIWGERGKVKRGRHPKSASSEHGNQKNALSICIDLDK